MTEKGHPTSRPEGNNYSMYKWWKKGGQPLEYDTPEADDWQTVPEENPPHSERVTLSPVDLRNAEQIPLELELGDPHALAAEAGHPAGHAVRRQFQELDERSSQAYDDLGRRTPLRDAELIELSEKGIDINTRRGRRLAARRKAHTDIEISHGTTGDIQLSDEDRIALGGLIDSLQPGRVARMRAEGRSDAEIAALERIRRERRGR